MERLINMPIPLMLFVDSVGCKRKKYDSACLNIRQQISFLGMNDVQSGIGLDQAFGIERWAWVLADSQEMKRS